MPVRAHAFAGGAGTSGDPYQITTAAELASVSSYLGSGNSGKYFKVMNDIDLNVSPYNTGTGWTPIGTSSSSTYFYGKFDGNFKTISGLYYNNSSGNYAGLFGTIGNTGIVSNTLLSAPTVTGSLEVGSLAGANYGTITKSGVTGGSVTGVQRIGGLVGSNYGTMTYDYSNNSVFFNPTSSPTCCAGGLIAEAYSGGTINNSYSRSSITITYNVYNQGAVGGLYGNDYSSGAKSNLYSTGAITMVSGNFPSSTGGLAGSNYTSTTGSYWDTQTSGWATSSGGAGVVGKTTAQMKTQDTYSGWDFSTIWAIDGAGIINNGYPYLRWQVTDVTAPTISSISSDKVDGAYNVGTVIDIDVTFSEIVTSTGNVTVTLETGSVDRTCTFSVTSAATGTCNYTVQAGDDSPDLTVLSIAGTIADGSANSMSNFVPAVNLAANKALVVDTVVPSTPGTPATTSSTSITTPTWTWTASTDTGSGLASPAYTVYWSQDSTFVSGVSSATSNSASYTHSSALATGTWYFRVKASDVIGNNSAYSSVGAVTISIPTTAIKVDLKPQTGSGNTSPTSTSPADDLSSTDPVNTAPTASTLLNDFPNYTSGRGKSIVLAANQTVSFRVDVETHMAVVQEVGDDYAVLVLHSKPMTVRLNVGEKKRYDVNYDGQPDISITLAGVNNGVAQLVFAQIKKPTVGSGVMVDTKNLVPHLAASGVAVMAVGGLWVASRRRKGLPPDTSKPSH